MRVLRFLYSFEGRFTVGDLQMHLFVTCLSGLPMAALVGLLAWQFSSWMILGVGLVVIIIVQTVGQISATIRRLHDHNLSGWWLPAFLIVLLGSLLGASLTASPSEPLNAISIAFVAIGGASWIAATHLIMLIPGQPRTNRFGMDPLRPL